MRLKILSLLLCLVLVGTQAFAKLGTTPTGASRSDSAIMVDGIAATPGSTAVTVLLYDTDGKVLISTGTTVPGAEAGYAKGALFIDTDVTAGTTGTYVNIGSTTVANFDAISAATAGSVALSYLASGTDAQIIVANSSGVPAYVTVSGDITITNSGAATIGENKVKGSMLSLNSVSLVINSGAINNTVAVESGSTILGHYLTSGFSITNSVLIDYTDPTLTATATEAVAEDSTVTVIFARP